MPEQYDEDRLAHAMRAGLQQQAAQAPDRLSRPLASRPGGRGRLMMIVAAATVSVVALPLAVLTLAEIPRDGSRDPAVADRAEPPTSVAGWRVESYGGIQVRVPPTWGWGGAWFHDPSAGGRVLDCGAAPFVVPGDPDYERVPQDSPYVGRPTMMTDACAVAGLARPPAQPAPQADSVWIGAAVKPGTETLPNGYVRETIRVAEPTRFGDGTVSVTSDDPVLRRRILATAEAVAVDDNGCRTDATWAEFPAGNLEDQVPASLSVCLYETFRGDTTLLWSERRSADDAREYVEQVAGTSATYDTNRLCTEQPDGQWLAIGAAHADGTTAWTAVTMGECAQILWHYPIQGGVESLAASPVIAATVAPWAAPAVRAYVVGPVGWFEYAGDDAPPTFRGNLG